MPYLKRFLKTLVVGARLRCDWDIVPDNEGGFLFSIFEVNVSHDKKFVPTEDERGRIFLHRASIEVVIFDIALELYAAWEE